VLVSRTKNVYGAEIICKIPSFYLLVVSNAFFELCRVVICVVIIPDSVLEFRVVKSFLFPI
jgi:ABC-type siderophore export system fused ATPase/permease subunit